jgi:hypothetical protein
MSSRTKRLQRRIDARIAQAVDPWLKGDESARPSKEELGELRRLMAELRARRDHQLARRLVRLEAGLLTGLMGHA